MSDAALFQQSFGDALFAPSAPANDPALARALAVHRNTSAKAGLDALSDNFPVVRALVGGEPFAAAATRFVEGEPPTDPRLCLYGAGFSRFLSGYAPFANSSDLPDLASYIWHVAELEWLVIEALFSLDAVALDGSSFGADLALDLPLRLHPATHYAHFATPAGSIWLAHAHNDTDTALKEIVWTEEVVLITRPDGALIVTILPAGAMPFLEACRAGLSLGEAALAGGDDLIAVFAALVSAGAFA